MACSWMGWCTLDPTSQAAWLQAVGSLAAIGLAVYLPWKQRQREAAAARKVAMARARALALVYLELFRQWHDSVQGALARFGETNGEPDWADWTSIMSMLAVTNSDKDLMRRSDEFAHASPTVQTFLYHAVLAGFAADKAKQSDDQARDAQAFRRHAMAASAALAKAIRELEEIAADGAPNPYRSAP